MHAALFALARSEITRLFRQPLAWLVLALGEGALALCFLLLIVRYLEAGAELQGAGVTVEIVMRYFGIASFAILLATPLLTMSTLAGDKRDGMLRFLFTTPLSSAAIVAGKLLGVLSLATTQLVLIALIPLTLLWGAPIDLGILGTNVLGLALFTLMHNCLGVMASALTRTPLAGALVAMGVSLMLWLAQWAERLDPQAATVGGWSTVTRLRGFAQGLVVSADVVYFLTASGLFVVISIALVAAERRLA